MFSEFMTSISLRYPHAPDPAVVRNIQHQLVRPQTASEFGRRQTSHPRHALVPPRKAVVGFGVSRT